MSGDGQDGPWDLDDVEDSPGRRNGLGDSRLRPDDTGDAPRPPSRPEDAPSQGLDDLELRPLAPGDAPHRRPPGIGDDGPAPRRDPTARARPAPAWRRHLRDARRRWRRLSPWLRWPVASVAGVVGATVALVLPLRWIEPPTTAFMIREAWIQDADVLYTWVDLEEVAPAVAIAIVASEDQKFPHHHGFDLESIQDALEDDADRPRGASTLSQQVVKNLWLWPGRSWARKGIEAWLTVFVELLLPKRRILEIYVNVAQFDDRVFGVGAAARELFGKPAARLTGYEAALLAAVLPSPSRSSAVEPSEYIRRRARWIQRQVRQLGGPAYLGLGGIGDTR